MKLWEDTKMTEVDFSTISFLTLDEEQKPPIVTEIRRLDNDKSINIQYQTAGGIVIVDGNAQFDGVSIYDLQGRLITSDNTASKAYRLSIANAPRGVFVVKVKCGGKVESKKLVK